MQALWGHTHECMRAYECECVGLLPVSLEGNRLLKSLISSTNNEKRERERVGERGRKEGGREGGSFDSSFSF